MIAPVHSNQSIDGAGRCSSAQMHLSLPTSGSTSVA